MAKISTELTLKRARASVKKKDILSALRVYQEVLDKFPRNKSVLGEVSEVKRKFLSNLSYPEKLIGDLKSLLESNKLKEVTFLAEMQLNKCPLVADLWRVYGIASQNLGRLTQAEKAFENVLLLSPDSVEDLLQYSNILKDQDRLEEASQYLRKAISLQPDYYKGYTNLGIILLQQGAPKEEIAQAYRTAISINPADAFAHQNLSYVVKYKADDPQIPIVEQLLKNENQDIESRINLHFAFARMKEDTGDLKTAVEHYEAAGALRQQVIGYSFQRDERLFSIIRNTAQGMKDNALPPMPGRESVTPIFVVGMPRSGTTLVEQILSSHSMVHGAGELKLLEKHGFNIALGRTEPTPKNLMRVRKAYLEDLAKLSEGKPFVVDKLPQNFLLVALICASMPHAKIVHIQRDGAATCWSSFTKNFRGKSLGYSNDLRTSAQYYKLYEGLMLFWRQMFGDRLHHLNYEQLTSHQEAETKGLIDYVGLDWEEACLSPQNNKRIVKTASLEQVRKKVYTGSSEKWRRYEPFIHGAFDILQTKEVAE
ncbi:sulfotransferase [uncultured Cohaesibacter sp.]|uniref:tetratricopeptide repeat-containing sulfotransferase family protein n=1 Tax=uncultured Cohaesibacter sp. TaxID=1002546 RepID=UPI0029C6C781|nr:sulfotransferase [uncultured Cohaesibacter sp.]